MADDLKRKDESRRYVCSNLNCQPIARGSQRRIPLEYRVPDLQRSYYTLSDRAIALWQRGKHPGCLRCGAKLVPAR